MATYWENSCSFGLRYVSWYKYLIVSLVFSHLGFWSGNLFLIAPFPDLCLLVPFFQKLSNISLSIRSTCESFAAEEETAEVFWEGTSTGHMTPGYVYLTKYFFSEFWVAKGDKSYLYFTYR